MSGCFEVLFVIALVIAGIGGVIWLFEQAAADRAAEEARRAAEEAERKRYLAEQERLRQQIAEINEQSLKSFEDIPLTLAAAESHLDQAQRDFEEGAFAPFWDSVEKAATALGAVDRIANSIGQNSTKFVDLVKQYRGHAPVFAVSPASAPKLRVASETSNRMYEIVRRAQRDFQFSVIYEQRKTNHLLVVGFRNLAHALEEMSWRISSSLDDLARSVDGMSSTLNESLRTIADNSEAQHRSFVEDAARRSQREEKALEMLDNIQRKRYPGHFH